MIQRSLNEVGNEERVQIHFKFHELRQGYAFIGREHALDNTDVFKIVDSIDKLRARRSENPEINHVLRRVFINKHRNKKVPNKNKTRSPRPDNKKNAIDRELNIAHILSTYRDDVEELKTKNPTRVKNNAMLSAFENAKQI